MYLVTGVTIPICAAQYRKNNFESDCASGEARNGREKMKVVVARVILCFELNRLGWPSLRGNNQYIFDRYTSRIGLMNEKYVRPGTGSRLKKCSNKNTRMYMNTIPVTWLAMCTR